jgi:ABC-type nickel/cobalt efflux system permease component RcnA
MRRHIGVVWILALTSWPAWGHDIPNARVDRSIQATIHPGRLAVDYEVSLAELTLTQDLRALIGTLPGADRNEWFDRYARETGPLIAKGLIVQVDGRPLDLRFLGFNLIVEEHPQYTFHFEAGELPAAGQLGIHDTNFAASEGTSRLGVRARGGVTLRGDDLPGEVNLIPVRPVWQLSDLEEKRTKQVELSYLSPSNPETLPDAAPTPRVASDPKPSASAANPGLTRSSLSKLLDRGAGLSLVTLGLIAFGLGAVHALQPGHGKTLVAATVLGDRGSWLKGTALALVTTLTHTGSVLAVAGLLWVVRSASPGLIHLSLARGAGFTIAAIGFWRLGRHLGGFGEHDHPEGRASTHRTAQGLIGLGIAGGIVPCWDAVGVLVLAEALGRLALGIGLIVAFSSGMAVVLAIIGASAARFRQLVERRDRGPVWIRGLSVASALILAGIGVTLMSAG